MHRSTLLTKLTPPAFGNLKQQRRKEAGASLGFCFFDDFSSDDRNGKSRQKKPKA